MAAGICGLSHVPYAVPPGISPLALFSWSALPQMDQSFNMQVKMGMSQDGESDEIKRIFLEGNPYLLVRGRWARVGR